jgi:hypothetical protein
VANVYFEDLRRSFAIQHRAGILRASSEPGVWRLTWRGAIMIAASRISPGPDFVRRRVRSRADRLQHELDGDATRTRAERIGSRAGWTMFVAGLVQIAAAVVISPTGSLLASMGMAIGSSLNKRDAYESRAIVIGGAASTLLVGIPIGLSLRRQGGFSLLPMSKLLSAVTLMPLGWSLGSWVFPMALIILGTALMVEGFRAAAT